MTRKANKADKASALRKWKGITATSKNDDPVSESDTFNADDGEEGEKGGNEPSDNGDPEYNPDKENLDSSAATSKKRKVGPKDKNAPTGIGNDDAKSSDKDKQPEMLELFLTVTLSRVLCLGFTLR